MGSHSDGMGKLSSSTGVHSVETSTTVSIITSSAEKQTKEKKSAILTFAYIRAISKYLVMF